ncbi:MULTISPECIES: STY0301 family protein [unclassified Pseudomonas]|uniref:STY0301 family protein n=1 Tax=unclassified Pseudomonas TaxID=196821 RepID=UPI00244A99C6|nr:MULTISPECIES: STY0301 family protein [unclassified Pseudomonas]MDG9928457.1 hypothetical protein [Pseudomonas sp. GD04042]MDH0482627.1 hypothetical protein [Pseudomonas sp. GD04015]MDH0604671.1 hypothetical protein [Pseudomonas sp. GD03869]
MKYPLLALCLLATSTLQAQVFVCPQAPKAAGADWQHFTPDTPATGGGWRSIIELYAGDPRQGAALIESDSVNEIGVAPLDWTLSGQPPYMACTFADNELRLVRPLPAGLGYCVADNEFEDLHAQLECR